VCVCVVFCVVGLPKAPRSTCPGYQLANIGTSRRGIDNREDIFPVVDVSPAGSDDGELIFTEKSTSALSVIVR